MARDKARDDKLFNCSQSYELDYVVNLYHHVYRGDVKYTIQEACQNGMLHDSTHMDVYKLIKIKLDLDIPVHQ